MVSIVSNSSNTHKSEMVQCLMKADACVRLTPTIKFMLETVNRDYKKAIVQLKSALYHIEKLEDEVSEICVITKLKNRIMDIESSYNNAMKYIKLYQNIELSASLQRRPAANSHISDLLVTIDRL